MASDDAALARLFFMIIPNTKRHPNNTKTDQLSISEVITGLSRPYHNTRESDLSDSSYEEIHISLKSDFIVGLRFELRTNNPWTVDDAARDGISPLGYW